MISLNQNYSGQTALKARSLTASRSQNSFTARLSEPKRDVMLSMVKDATRYTENPRGEVRRFIEDLRKTVSRIRGGKVEIKLLPWLKVSGKQLFAPGIVHTDSRGKETVIKKLFNPILSCIDSTDFSIHDIK